MDRAGPGWNPHPQTGLIVCKGYIVAEWGDPAKADNTFSVSKSFLSTSVGLACDWEGTHVGVGSNVVYVDPANDLVIVCRWIRGGAFSEVLEAVGG